MARKSASQAVLSRVQLTLHATSPTPHGASRFVLAMSAWSVKPDVLRPGVVGMRGSMVIQLRPCMIVSTPPTSSDMIRVRTLCVWPPFSSAGLHDNTSTAVHQGDRIYQHC